MNPMHKAHCQRLYSVVMTLCGSLLGADPDFPQIRLSDVTAQSGIDFRHSDGSSGRYYIIEYVSAGLALFDYDLDGDVDIYFLNGAALPGTEFKSPPHNVLYRNDGQFRFTDVTESAGVGDTGHGLGVTVGDYDNDGDPDLYLNNYGPNVLYRNNGDGGFTDVTANAGVANGHRVGAGANFLDMDADGDLDLFVSNYIKFSHDQAVLRTRLGFRIYPSPRDYAPDPDTLFRNNGDGTFTDVSQAAGIARHAGPGMGTVCADYDMDGDTDIFVGNDVEANFLFRNDGNGHFEELALLAGVAFDFGGLEHGSMGVVCADYDNDGRLDFHVTSYQQELATLYRNIGAGQFQDVTLQTRAGTGTRQRVTWGNALVDLDNDGDRDLFICRGDLDDNVEQFEDLAEYGSANLVLMNDGAGRFVNVSDQVGNGLHTKLSSRGAGFDDLDGDGDIDAVILNSRQAPTLLRNDTGRDRHWIDIRLQGVKANRSGIGAQVKVVAGALTQVDEVHSGRGYQSHFGSRLHFGLGEYDRIDRIEVRWIGAGTDVWQDVPVDHMIILKEGDKHPIAE
jgi:enediyne biosynthesis protein E4